MIYPWRYHRIKRTLTSEEQARRNHRAKERLVPIGKTTAIRRMLSERTQIHPGSDSGGNMYRYVPWCLSLALFDSLSVLWGFNWGPSWNLSEYYNTMVSQGFRGALNWSPTMPIDVGLSDNRWRNFVQSGGCVMLFYDFHDFFWFNYLYYSNLSTIFYDFIILTNLYFTLRLEKWIY